MQYRLEKDSLGEVRVPAGRRYGAQTVRSLENFPIGTEKMPRELHRALIRIKRAAVSVNSELGLLDQSIARAILQAADEVLEGRFDEDFVLSVWQTGSGTQTNMNVNEVLANRASEILGKERSVHPNDHVNRSQSSNDVFPSAMHLAALEALQDLMPALETLRATLDRKANSFMDLVKTGRTHLQDATPLTLGQEMSGWVALLERDQEMLRASAPFLSYLALGGTAVGTGLNAPKGFDELMCRELTRLTGLSLQPAHNKFQALSGKNELAFVHGALRTLAMDLLKIVNDVRVLASGPRCGLGELLLPENEPGSSIMPGKVNPTQCEAVSMVAAQVLGNDVTVGFCAGQGHFELNVYMPVIIHNFLQSCRLLTDAMRSFEERCARGIMADEARLASYASRSLMNVTALTPLIGYDKAAAIAKKAHAQNLSLKEAALSEGVSESDYDRAVDLLSLCFPHK
ncbi:MAG: class II fumarate hydratase [Fretibacterium sp.]|nr:class II fumarate hydratase [Fretibacterium sp.]